MGDRFSQAIVLIDQIILRKESGVDKTIVGEKKVVRFTRLRLETRELMIIERVVSLTVGRISKPIFNERMY